MSMITIEDCCEYVSNRFDLVLIASQRGKELNHGARPLIKHSKDKEAIIALREIAAGKIKDIESLQKAIVGKTLMENQERSNEKNDKLTSDINAEVIAEIDSMKETKQQTNNHLFKDEEIIEEK